jgi:CheY-like chemotaxis protein
MTTLEKAKILVVSPDPVDSSFLEGLLTPLGGKLSFASSLPDMAAQAEKEKPDLVILDAGLLEDKDTGDGPPAGQKRRRRSGYMLTVRLTRLLLFGRALAQLFRTPRIRAVFGGSGKQGV